MQKFHVVPLPITQDWVFCREAFIDSSQFVYVLLLLMIPLTGIFLMHHWLAYLCSYTGNLLQGFEALNRRAVAVVVDPIQSVKGKVVIDAFRLINPNTVMLGQEAHPILAILTNHP